MLTVNNNPFYLKAVKQSQKTRALPVGIQLRQIKYLNNMFEQDHQFFKKRVPYMLGFQPFQKESTTLARIESMHMIKKGQTLQREKSVRHQIQLIKNLFGLTT